MIEYSDLQLESTVDPMEEVHISLRLTNTGSVARAEIVQLYLADPHASMSRPVKELQGFARVSLEPGESKCVTFTAAPSQMAFLGEDGKWVIEAGQIDVEVGASSEDIRFSSAFRITRTQCIAGRDRAFCAKTTIDKPIVSF